MFLNMSKITFVTSSRTNIYYFNIIVLECVSSFTKVWAWLNAPCLFLRSLSSPPHGKSPPPVAHLGEHAWDQEDKGNVQSLLGIHTSSLLQTEHCACFSRRDNICELAVANWVSAWAVDGYCSRLRLSKRYRGSFVQCDLKILACVC